MLASAPSFDESSVDRPPTRGVAKAGLLRVQKGGCGRPCAGSSDTSGRGRAKPLLIHGLERLEYRGYDSAGLALLEDDGLDYVRAVGNLDNLKQVAKHNGSMSSTGLGHTRWATHGKVSEQNAHPLTGCDERKLAVVLNGIVENFRELKASLEKEGHEFTHRDGRRGRRPPSRASTTTATSPRPSRAAYHELEGHFAFVVVHRDHPEQLVGARVQCPLIVGVGDGEMFLASAATAFLRDTNRLQLIEDGEVVSITPEGATFTSVENGSADRARRDRGRLGRRGRREVRLRDVHAQGDLRAARRRPRDDRRPRPPRQARCSRASG